jgi:RNA polymerase sigma factor (sigma-70 family)
MAKHTTKGRGGKPERAEEALREALAYAESIVQTVRQPLVVLDADLRVVSANRSFYQTFQVRPPETRGRLIYDLGNRQWDIPKLRELLEEILPKNTLFEDFEVDHQFEQIGRRTMLLNARRIYREANRTQMILLAIEDITDRQRAQEELRQSEEWLSTTLRSIGDAVIATDAEGRVRFLNPTAQSLTGWGQTETAGKPLKEVFNIVNRETGAPVEDPVTKVMREGLVVGLANHAVLIARDGTRRPIDDRGAPIRDSAGNTIGVVLVFHDIAEQKQVSEDLRRLTGRLLEAQEEDRRRVAYDIHDGLGQMLSAASMHLEAFAAHRPPAPSPTADEEFVKAKRCLRDAVVEMRRMVSELGPLLLEEVGLVEASRRLLADLSARQSWETEFEGDVNLERLDRMAEMGLFRIVQEALANAAKHAKTKKVRIGFRREGDALFLEVRDWGKGFDVDRVLAQRGPGLHVGLLGIRERATLIGGEFNIESAPAKGTRITVSAPVAPPEAPVIGRKKVEEVGMTEGRKDREPSAGGITVLIADDHPMVREGLRSMLAVEGIEVIGEAATGAEAVERVQQLGPDVVLMDVRMPDLDGLAATEVIKESSPETSVIVITSYESKDYLRRAIQAGAAGYLLKGMSRESLIDAIRLVRGGGSLIDARLLSELLTEMGVQETRFKGAEGALEALTPREQEVLQLLVRGLTNKEIAAEMHYSVGTVKNAVQRVIEKLGVSDRTQAAVYAVRAGLSPPT